MNCKLISRELDEIRTKTSPGVTPREGQHKRLFELFAELEKTIIKNGEHGFDGNTETKADGLLEAQCVIMNAAASVDAHSIQDVLYKLALWRWFAPDLDHPADELEPLDAITYSAFRDLSHILKERSVLTDFDVAC